MRSTLNDYFKGSVDVRVELTQLIYIRGEKFIFRILFGGTLRWGRSIEKLCGGCFREVNFEVIREGD